MGNEQAVEFCNRGVDFFSSNEYEKALECFNLSIQEDKFLANAYLNKAAVFFKQNKLDDALKTIDELLIFRRRSFKAYSMKSEILTAAGKFEQAIEESEKAIKYSLRAPRPFLAKANALAKLGKYKDACEAYEKVLALDSKNLDALRNLRSIYMQLAEYKKAKEYALNINEINPDSQDDLIAEGIVTESIGPDEAKEFYIKALEKYPDSTEFTLSLARIMERLNDFDTAAEMYQKASKLAGGIPNAEKIANALKFHSSREKLTELLESDPKNIEVYFQLGEIFFNKKDKTLAEIVFNSYMKNLRTCGDIHYMPLYRLALMFLQTECYDYALTIFEDIACNENSDIYYMTALTYISKGDMDKAEINLKKAIALKPSESKYRSSLANVYIQTERYLEAIVLCEETLSANDSLSEKDKMIRLGFCCFKAGFYTQALNYFDKIDSDEIEAQKQDIHKIMSIERVLNKK